MKIIHSFDIYYDVLSNNNYLSKMSFYSILKCLPLMKIIKFFYYNKKTDTPSDFIINKKHKFSSYFKLCLIFIILMHVCGF